METLSFIALSFAIGLIAIILLSTVLVVRQAVADILTHGNIIDIPLLGTLFLITIALIALLCTML